MNERSIRIRTALGAATLAPFGVLVWAGLTTPLSAQPVPVLVAASPEPVALALSLASDRTISARLGGPVRPGVTTVELRSLRDQTVTSVAVDSAVPGSSFVLPAAWNGELRITRPASPGARAESAFVGVVVEPMLAVAANVPPRILYGPGGRTSVRFAEGAAPPEGTQVVITSPAISTPPPPPRMVGDTVEVGLMPAPALATTGVVGVTPWAPQKRLVLSVFDPAQRRWSPLPSHADRDGTVFATGPLPGVYALVAQ